jgi:hypothetical protein
VMPYAEPHELRSPANDAMVAGGNISPRWRHRLRHADRQLGCCARPVRGLDTAVDDLKSMKLCLQHMINQWTPRQASRRPRWHMTERLELLGPVVGLSAAHKTSGSALQSSARTLWAARERHETTKQLVDRSIQ